MALPSKTYYINENTNRISSTIDGSSAMAQAIYKNLGTLKYNYLIYSKMYGFDEELFIGEDYSFIETNLPYYIEECLKTDDRVLNITNFNLTQTGVDTCVANFDVVTTEGIVENVEKEVQYGK